MNSFVDIGRTFGGQPPRLKEALQRAADIGDGHGQAGALRLLGVERLRRGEISNAIDLLEEILDLCGVLMDKQGSVLSLWALTHAAMQAGESEWAHELSVYSLQLAADLGDRSGVAEDLCDALSVAEFVAVPGFSLSVGF